MDEHASDASGSQRSHAGWAIDTLLVHHARDASTADASGATVPPTYTSATFDQERATAFGRFDYSRSNNPTREALERTLAALDGGVRALAYSAGVAALDALADVLLPGDEVVCSQDVYGGTCRLFSEAWAARGVVVKYVDATDTGAVRAACTSKTRLIHAEALGNPLLTVCDVAALAGVARSVRALLSIDNTTLTPINLRPLSLGADVVIHSATKYLNGHSDVTAGTLTVTDRSLAQRLAFHQNARGSALAPRDCAELHRGIATLSVRLERQQRTAAALAKALHERFGPTITVLYPGLEAHPRREVHRRQSRGDGAVVSLCTGDADVSARIAESLELFSIRVSFGSVTSSISMPCFMSHRSIPSDLRRHAPPPDLLRLSVGLEDAEDLLADLTSAIERAGIKGGRS